MRRPILRRYRPPNTVFIGCADPPMTAALACELMWGAYGYLIENYPIPDGWDDGLNEESDSPTFAEILKRKVLVPHHLALHALVVALDVYSAQCGYPCNHTGEVSIQ